MARTKKFADGTVPLNASIEPSDRDIVESWMKWLGLGKSEATRALLRTASHAVEDLGVEAVVAPEDEAEDEGDGE